MLKIKLKLQEKFSKFKLNKNSEKVSMQVSTSSILWIIISSLLKIFILVFFGLLVLFPFYYMISTSLMTNEEVIDTAKTHLLPQEAQWKNYSNAFAEGYWIAIFVSFLIATITIFLKTIVTILLGYAFSIRKHKGKKILWAFFLSLMMLPEIALLSGQYQMIVKLEWHYGNSVLLGLFVPFIASVFSAIMFKNSFEAIPDQMKESSMIDGASGIIYFLKVAIPMVKTTILTVIVLTAFASWNSYMWPALLLQGKKIQTIPTWVFTTGKNADDELIIPIRMAGTVIAILPMFFVYFGFRRKIMQAISRQGIATKG